MNELDELDELPDTATCTDCQDEIDVEVFGYHLLHGHVVCADCIERN